MAQSYNGYEVITSYGDSRLAPLRANGKPFAPLLGVLSGDVAYIMNTLANWLDHYIEPMDPRQSWSFVPKQVTGGSGWSCHSSATAFDFNAQNHGQGARGTWSADQIRRVDEYLRTTMRGHVRWGEHYTAPTKVDGMHFEWMGSPLSASVLADELRAANAPPRPPVVTKPTPAPSTTSTPSAPVDEKEWYEMPIDDESLAKISKAVFEQLRNFHNATGVGLDNNAYAEIEKRTKAAVQSEGLTIVQNQAVSITNESVEAIAARLGK